MPLTPDQSLINLLPPIYKQVDADNSLAYLIQGLDQVWGDMIDNESLFVANVALAKTTLLIDDWLDSMGNPFKFLSDTASKQRLAQNLLYIYKRRGRRQAVIDVVRFLLGINITITMDYEASWVLGVSKLGADTVLFSAENRWFLINYPAGITADQLQNIKYIVNFMKPMWLGPEYAAYTAIISAPYWMFLTDTAAATATPITGALSYTWTVSGGTLVSGQGTTAITYTPLGASPVTLSLLIHILAGDKTATATTQVISNVATAITAPDYVFAGQFNVACSCDSPFGTWTGTNLEFDGVNTGANVSVDIGEAGTPCTLSANFTTPLGPVAVTHTFKVVPYVSNAVHTTANLNPALDNLSGYEDFTMDLGWQYELLSMQTDHPAILRVYETAAARTADSSRALTASPSVDPTLQTAIVFEGQTTGALLNFPLEHQVVGTNGDSPRTKTAYCRLYNMDSVMRAITLTLSRAELQTGPTF